MATLFDRIAYVIIGPAYDPISLGEIFDAIAGTPISINGIPFLPTFNPTGGIIMGNQYIYGWPYIHPFDPPKKDNIALYGLRTVFDIRKNFGKQKSNGRIQIYNVKRDTWKKMENRDREFKIYLVVGYTGLGSKDIPASLIYIGDIEEMSYKKSGTDWILTVDAKDGQKIHENSFINKSFSPGSNLKDILLDILKNAKNIQGSFVQPAIQWIEQSLLEVHHAWNGYVCSGHLIPEVNKLLDIFGATLIIDNDIFKISWQDSNYTQYAILLTKNTGLLNTPISKDKGIELKTLLIPTIKPNVLLKIVSKNTNGFYVVEGVHIKGDTHGNEWSCTIEANKRSNMTKEIPIGPAFVPSLMMAPISTEHVLNPNYSLITEKSEI